MINYCAHTSCRTTEPCRLSLPGIPAFGVRIVPEDSGTFTAYSNDGELLGTVASTLDRTGDVLARRASGEIVAPRFSQHADAVAYLQGSPRATLCAGDFGALGACIRERGHVDACQDANGRRFYPDRGIVGIHVCECVAYPAPHGIHCSDCSAPSEQCVCDDIGTESLTFRREYVRTGEWANESTQLATCYVEHMAESVKFACYTGDGEVDRYYTLLDGLMTEVTFRFIDRECDEDDWLDYKYGVFAPGVPEPIETFTVRIDGRA